MGIKAMTWAFEQPISGNEKVILLALADHADDDGYCWPSISRLVERSYTSESTVRRTLSDLRSMGFIEVESRTSEEGRSMSNGYQLMMKKVFVRGVNMTPYPVTSEGVEGVTVDRVEGVTVDTPYEPSEGTIIKNPQKEKENTKEKENESDFDEFWAAYPRRPGDSKKKAEEKYRAAIKRKVKHEDIMAGVRAYAATRGGQDPIYTAMASTWLNQERWLADYGPIADPADIEAFCHKYPTQNIGSRELIKYYFNLGLQSATAAEIMDGLEKYCVLFKQKKNEGHPLQMPPPSAWLQMQKWREMDNYEIAYRGMGEKYLRVKKGAGNA